MLDVRHYLVVKHILVRKQLRVACLFNYASDWEASGVSEPTNVQVGRHTRALRARRAGQSARRPRCRTGRAQRRRATRAHDPADLDLLRDELCAVLEHATPVRAKTVLQAMIDGIRVDARDNIEPTFRVPAVREPCGSMVPTGRV